MRRSLTFLAVLATIVALYVAQDFFLPVTLAVILTLVLRPVARGLERVGLPPLIGAALIILGLAGGLGTAVYFGAGPAQQWVEDAPTVGRQLQYKFRETFRSASALGDVGEQVQEIAEGPQKGNVQEVVVREPGLISQFASGGANLLAGVFLCTILLFFLLATGNMFLERLINAQSRFRDKVRALRIARQIEQEISRYLFTVTLINLALGGCIGLGLWAVGLPNPALWGGAAALLNFIPYVGAIVGGLVVFAVSVVTFSTPLEILLPPLVFLTLTTIEGQLVTPTVVGRRLDMNPVAVFVSVAFWAWLWGVTGAVMAVPIMLIVKISADHIERWAPLAGFLAGRSTARPTPRLPDATD